ncbi:hypothetical protein [Roseibium sp.]|uniref:hypothetical protein n=1 Tax=Roseibium sp. TaxID=1936156 RepID=UPI003A96C61D
MLIVLICAIALYLIIAASFFVFSAMELVDTDRSSPFKLAVAAVTSLLWPVTLLVMSGLLASMKVIRALLPGHVSVPVASGPHNASNVTLLRRVD